MFSNRQFVMRWVRTAYGSLRECRSGQCRLYCKTEGVPKGCVAHRLRWLRLPNPSSACQTRGVPKGCVMR